MSHTSSYIIKRKSWQTVLAGSLSVCLFYISALHQNYTPTSTNFSLTHKHTHTGHPPLLYLLLNFCKTLNFYTVHTCVFMLSFRQDPLCFVYALNVPAKPPSCLYFNKSNYNAVIGIQHIHSMSMRLTFIGHDLSQTSEWQHVFNENINCLFYIRCFVFFIMIEIMVCCDHHQRR